MLFYLLASESLLRHFARWRGKLLARLVLSIRSSTSIGISNVLGVGWGTKVPRLELREEYEKWESGKLKADRKRNIVKLEHTGVEQYSEPAVSSDRLCRTGHSHAGAII